MLRPFALLICLITFTLQAQTKTISITGKVKNPTSETVTLNSLDDYAIAEATIDQGQFEIKAKIKRGFYLLRHGNEVIDLYLDTKDELGIHFNGEDYDASIQFTGKGANRNNYLAEKNLLDQSARKDISTFYEGAPGDFFEKFNTLQASIKALQKKQALETFFLEDEATALAYERLLSIYNYSGMQEFYFGKDTTLPDTYTEPLKDVDYDNEQLFNTQPYYRYLASSKWKNDIKKATDQAEMQAVFDAVKTVGIKIELLKNFYYGMSTQSEKAKDYFAMIRSNTGSEEFIQMAKEKLITINKTAKGKPSPDFSFESIDGKIYSLSDFKGNYVFIDVWATWCAPCIQQIPAIKRLEETFKDKNITFVSISVDDKKAYTKWKDFVKKKQLEGVQLYADNSFESAFIQAYGISSIPRFIIIDPEGKIVNANAKKPSTQQCEAEIAALFE
jgi:peroxiredoxin